MRWFGYWSLITAEVFWVFEKQAKKGKEIFIGLFILET